VSEPVVLARVTRSGLVESVHVGHVVACDAEGRVLASAGDPERVVYARSSMKPVQAAVSLGHIPDDLSVEEIAVMCASHNGEARHLEVVHGLLERAGTGPEALRCPPSWPWFPVDARHHDGPRPELHPCSGKHAGMVLACTRAGFPVETYLKADHALQREVHATASGLAGVAPVKVGTDGCGVPVHAFPLRAMATLFARLAGAGELFGRAVTSMQAAPYLVAGRDRVDTALMERLPGVVSKVGAEGLMCAAVPEQGIGLSVRVEDGSTRADGPALLRAMQLLDLVSDDDLDALSAFSRPAVLGGDRAVGEVAAEFRFDP
jgi:L-asparaginase II